MEKFKSKNGVSVRAYKGDAMTLLAFDVDEALKDNLAGFTIKYSYKVGNKTEELFMFNRLSFSKEFWENHPPIPKEEKNSTLYSPIQKFNWVHVPNTNANVDDPVFGDYTYQVTPRHIVNGILLELDESLTVKVKINVNPFAMKSTQVSFTRGFVSSVAYAKRFNVNNNRVRPPKSEDELLFDIKQVADVAKRWNVTKKKYEEVEYTFEEQHKWLGWQARRSILKFLDEAVNDATVFVKAFAYDLNEPEICKRLLQLAKENRLKIILDDAGEHDAPSSWENAFEEKFKNVSAEPEFIQRGNFLGLNHSKVFILLRNDKAFKVLSGSTNFSTNGVYINSNHVIIFTNNSVAQLYSDVFDASFGEENMSSFKGSVFSTSDFPFNQTNLPAMSISFAPHPKAVAQAIFDRISNRINSAETDLLFAIMKDTSASSILDAVQNMVKTSDVFTYGITDTISKNDADYSVFLYKPNSKRGIRVAARGISNVLPKPFGKVAAIDGYAIHHKFVVVDFKGKNPVVYCGSSNLAFGPEQKNGDNLLEIQDKDLVTVFAIEALRLVDHFHWRNNVITTDELNLDDISKPATAWYNAWFAPGDLRSLQRELYISEAIT